jgi:hypothetical protein
MLEKRYKMSFPTGQRGAVLVLYAIGMLAMLAIGGLALDGAHQMLNKDRLQNTVDAAALAAAKILDQTGDTNAAQVEATAMFGNNADDAGNRELFNSFGNGDISLTVEFSAESNPFQPGTLPAEYVRVRATNFTMAAWLIAALGISEKHVAASAVAGPTPTIGNACDLVPLIMCVDTTPPPDTFWGYDDGGIHVMKGGSMSGSSSGPIGPGNFFVARMGGSGGSVARDNLAGGYEDCQNVGDEVDTEPGNMVGPVAQGTNTRLNIFEGPISPGDYPPDVIVRQQNTELEYDADTATITLENGTKVVTSADDLDFSYDSPFSLDNYVSNLGPPGTSTLDLQPDPMGVAAYDRRAMPVIMADCDGINNGQTQLPIKGIGCFFLLQEVKMKGNEAEMFGEFVEECDSGGVSGPDPTSIPGPYKIVLYKDTGSFDS